MIGDRVRQLREAKGWSQAHLAEASGISTRTIQRVETHHAYSGETAMALAAVLEVPVADLVAPSAAAPGEHRPLWAAPRPLNAAWIALGLTAPGALFILLNSLKQAGISPTPYDALAALGTRLGIAEPFLRIWTIPLIVMPLLALALLGMSMLRAHGRVEGRALSVSGLEVRWHPLAVFAALIAAATVIAPLGNLAAETLAQAIGKGN
jgi:transcriptional regulator with XRE-family HTH domain